MKYYAYSQSDASWADLDYLEETEGQVILPYLTSYKVFGEINPEEADYFLCPIFYHATDDTHKHYEYVVERLPYFKGNESKHIFIDILDSEEIVPCLKDSINFKTSATVNNNAYPMYYPVPDQWFHWLCFEPAKPVRESQYDISFQGTLLTNSIRERIPEAMDNCKQAGMSVYESYQDQFHYDLKLDERVLKQYTYFESILNSKFVLCPRGGGFSSYRVYEVLAAGRIPVIVADDIRLPLDHLYHWNGFAVFVPENDLINTHKYIADWLDTHDLARCASFGARVWRENFSQGGFKFRQFLDSSLSTT